MLFWVWVSQLIPRITNNYFWEFDDSKIAHFLKKKNRFLSVSKTQKKSNSIPFVCFGSPHQFPPRFCWWRSLLGSYFRASQMRKHHRKSIWMFFENELLLCFTSKFSVQVKTFCNLPLKQSKLSIIFPSLFELSPSFFFCRPPAEYLFLFLIISVQTVKHARPHPKGGAWCLGSLERFEIPFPGGIQPNCSSITNFTIIMVSSIFFVAIALAMASATTRTEGLHTGGRGLSVQPRNGSSEDSAIGCDSNNPDSLAFASRRALLQVEPLKDPFEFSW